MVDLRKLFLPDIIIKFSCAKFCYDLQSTKSRRSASIGYGQRFQHLLREASKKGPSPQAYNLKGDFDKVTGMKSRAFSFGMSREYFRKVYLKENPPVDASVPGPG
jgi:hypothetical protein